MKMHQKNRKNKISSVLIMFCISIACKLLYDYQVCVMMPSFYIGILNYGVEFNADKILLAWFLFIVNSFFTHYLLCRKRSNINTCLVIVLYLYYIPISSSYYINDQPLSFLILSSLFWLIVCVIANIAIVVKNQHIHHITKLEVDKICGSKLFCFVMVLVATGCLGYAYTYNGLSFTLNIINIYDARAEYMGTSSMLESVLFNFGGTILIPITLIYSLKRRKIILSIVSILAQLAVFSIARQKGHLLIIGIVVAIYVLYKWNLVEKFKCLVPYACIVVELLSILEYYFLSTNRIFMLFVRRMMYIPSWLNTIYYDFFSENRLLLWTQDVFLVGRLGINRYDSSVLDMINYQYFMGYVPSPNTGLFAEAYMHFGIIGVLVYPLVIVGFVRILFRYASYYDEEIQLLVVVSVAMSLTSLPVTSGIFCVTYLPLVLATASILWFESRRVRRKIKIN